MTASSPSDAVVLETNLPLPGRRQGKVRDMYRLEADAGVGPAILIVASDRVSAFDVVLPAGLPGKGRLLTSIATAWFQFIRDRGIVADHLLSTDPSDVPGLTDEQRASLDGRIMIGRAAEVIPIECVVRGYLAGSGWKDYQDTGAVCGHMLPAGLELSQQLAEPLFTPATKEETGHDENIDFDRACDIAGRGVMERLRAISLTIYTQAAAYARERGIILADTKFEFGYALDADGNRTDEIIIIDEVLTPDSSRFWPADEYEIGREQNSFDKQIIRNYLQGLADGGSWDKTAPGPPLPEDVIERTLERYRQAAALLFG